MRTTEMIAKLQALVDEHGDCELLVTDGWAAEGWLVAFSPKKCIMDTWIRRANPGMDGESGQRFWLLTFGSKSEIMGALIRRADLGMDGESAPPVYNRPKPPRKVTPLHYTPSATGWSTVDFCPKLWYNVYKGMDCLYRC